MLHHQQSKFQNLFALSLLITLSSCVNAEDSKRLETALQPDPQLTNQPTVKSTPTPTETTPIPSVEVSVTPSPSPSVNPQHSTEIQKLIDQDILPTNIDPKQIVTRKQYARYLFLAYNYYHRADQSSQIRLATNDSKPIFTDIPNSHPDYNIVQGLAEAGIIPSKLNGDKTAETFKPDQPLSREDLIGWKVPLDRSTPSNQSTGNLEDFNQINPQLRKRLQIDYQKGTESNLRRVYGYTTILQPQKNVTMQEVATILLPLVKVDG